MYRPNSSTNSTTPTVRQTSANTTFSFAIDWIMSNAIASKPANRTSKAGIPGNERTLFSFMTFLEVGDIVRLRYQNDIKSKVVLEKNRNKSGFL